MQPSRSGGIRRLIRILLAALAILAIPAGSTLPAQAASVVIQTTTLSTGTENVYYSTTLAVTGGSGAYTWSLASGSLPTGLTLSNSGIIFGTPTNHGTFTFTVMCTDSAGLSDTQALSLYIASSLSTITISTTNIPGGIRNTAYSVTLIASGGSGAYTWAIGSGSLPTGLTLSSDGVISGTPTVASIFSFTIICADDNSHAASKNYTMYVASSASSSLKISTSSLPNGSLNNFYSTTLAATGGSGTYNWAVTSGDLPTGVTLSSNGIIFGTPTAASTYSFTITIYDSNMLTASKTFSIYVSSITASNLAVSTTSLASGTVGTYYATTLAATGGSGSYTWQLSSGSLPAGLSLSTAGIIAGTPTTVATYTFTVLVYDTSSNAKTQSLTIQIKASTASTLSISTSSLSNGVINAYYNTSLVATGGSGAYTWSVASGTLPDGLSLSNAGAIYGTPTTVATYTFTVQVLDTNGLSKSKSFSLAIKSASSSSSTVTISTASLTGGKVSTAYSKTLAATGGTSPYTWALSDGSLPTGLTLNSDGVISGTPTAASTNSFTVTATDADSLSASKTYSLVITASAAFSISTTSLGSGTVGVAYSKTLTATGGTAPYTWQLSGGKLPTGLSLSSKGVISGTPATAQAFSFTVEATDADSATATKTYSVTIASSAPAATTPTTPATTTPSANKTETKSPATASSTTKTGSSSEGSSINILLLVVLILGGLFVIFIILKFVFKLLSKKGRFDD